MIFKHEPPLCARLRWTPPHHPIVIQSDWYTCDVNNYQNQNLHQLFKTDLICWNENQEFYWETYDEDGELVDKGEFDL